MSECEPVARVQMVNPSEQKVKQSTQVLWLDGVIVVICFDISLLHIYCAFLLPEDNVTQMRVSINTIKNTNNWKKLNWDTGKLSKASNSGSFSSSTGFHHRGTDG